MIADHLMLCSDRSHTFATLGALHAYHIKGDLDGVKKYSCCGSSVIVSLLMSCGLPPSQIAPLLVGSNIFEDSADTKKEITTLLTLFFKRKQLSIPSLQELHELTGKTLYLEAFNVTKRQLDVISHITHPMINCIAACCLVYGAPFLGARRSYCGSEYIDSSSMYPIPQASITAGDVPLCLYCSPDLMSISTFSTAKEKSVSSLSFRSASWWPWGDTTSDNAISLLERQTERDVKSLSLMYQRMLQLSVHNGPRGIRYIHLLVNSPNNTATSDQRLMMLADWEDYLSA